jgi:hypothetical protein
VLHIYKLSFCYIDLDSNPEVSLSAINYINKNIDENIIIDTRTKTTSEQFCLNYILTSKSYIKVADMLLYMSNDSECAYPCTSILMKIIKTKNEESKYLIQILKQDKFKEVIKQIVNVHNCNSGIMTNIIFIIYHLIEFTDLDDILGIINFNVLRKLFTNFQSGFDVIHEAIIYLIKGILVKRSTLETNIMLYNDDYTDMVHIFSNSLIFIRNKVLSQAMDVMKLSRGLFNFLTHVYTITNILNNINPNNSEYIDKVCLEIRVPEQLIDCIYCFYEKKLFTFIETGFDKFDVTLLNTKAIVFRSLFHCITLLKRLMELDGDDLVCISFTI